jgi:hypothetical protein
MSEPVKTVVTPVRRGTVVWGVIFVIIAGVAYASTLTDFTLDPTQWDPRIVVLVVVGIGALLIFAAIVGAILHSARHQNVPPSEPPAA